MMQVVLIQSLEIEDKTLVREFMEVAAPKLSQFFYQLHVLFQQYIFESNVRNQQENHIIDILSQILSINRGKQDSQLEFLTN